MQHFTDSGTAVGQQCNLQQLIMEAARQLLETSRRSLAEITLETGYSDVGSFKTLFSRRTGLSSSAYRKKSGQCLDDLHAL